ncbi:Cell cycle checkpoint protein rad17 [Phlyctochytrium planicorne]|nr:Cell cycle checkpoint protein rad17 [Phlyctochytrium planicorne]
MDDDDDAAATYVNTDDDEIVQTKLKRSSKRPRKLIVDDDEEDEDDDFVSQPKDTSRQSASPSSLKSKTAASFTSPHAQSKSHPSSQRMKQQRLSDSFLSSSRSSQISSTSTSQRSPPNTRTLRSSQASNRGSPQGPTRRKSSEESFDVEMKDSFRAPAKSKAKRKKEDSSFSSQPNDEVIDSFDDDDDDFFSTQASQAPSQKTQIDESSKQTPSRKLPATFGVKPLSSSRPTPSSASTKPVAESSSSSLVSSSSKPSDGVLWVDRYFPALEDEVAVNKKKIGEFPRHRMLVLTGPSGAGKTATIKMLSMEMGFDIVEWVNPVNESKFMSALENLGLNHDESYIGDFNPPKPYGKSIMQSFSEFLGRSRKLPTLTFATARSVSSNPPFPSSAIPFQNRRVILVEDLPNISHQATRQAFHTSIREFLRASSTKGSGRFSCPLIIVLSEIPPTMDFDGETFSLSRSGEANMGFAKVIPADLSTAFCTRIMFRPIATRECVKCLRRIAESEKLPDSLTNSKVTMEKIAEASGGDIRCAINALQFLALGKSEVPLSAPVAATKRRKTASTTAAKAKPKAKWLKGDEADVALDYVGGRQVNLVVFHALGKVLNGKRVETAEEQDQFAGDQFTISFRKFGDRVPLPPHLKKYERAPLKSNPESVFQASHLDPSTFISYLSENSLSFLSDIEECVASSKGFADADRIMGRWLDKGNGILSMYGSSIASRSMMFARLHPPPANGFFQMRKPQLFAAIQKTGETREDIDGFWMRALGRRIMEEQKRGVLAPGKVAKQGLGLSQAYSKRCLTHEVAPYLSIMLKGSNQSGGMGTGSQPHRQSFQYGSGSQASAPVRHLGTFNQTRPTGTGSNFVRPPTTDLVRSAAAPATYPSLYSVIEHVDLRMLASLSTYSKARPTSDFSQHQEFLNEFEMDVEDGGFMDADLNVGVAAEVFQVKYLPEDDIEEF